jgi:hypothetical protein
MSTQFSEYPPHTTSVILYKPNGQEKVYTNVRQVAFDVGKITFDTMLQNGKREVISSTLPFVFVTEGKV